MTARLSRATSYAVALLKDPFERTIGREVGEVWARALIAHDLPLDTQMPAELLDVRAEPLREVVDRLAADRPGGEVDSEYTRAARLRRTTRHAARMARQTTSERA